MLEYTRKYLNYLSIYYLLELVITIILCEYLGIIPNWYNNNNINRFP